jgi:hypothetical protein
MQDAPFLGDSMILRQINSTAARQACFLSAFALTFVAMFSFQGASKSFANRDSARTLSLFQGGALSRKAENAVPRTKLAEGEYAVIARSKEGGVGPFDPQVFDFHESWTLWRTKDRGYEADGFREFSSPKDEFHRDRFWLRLTREWRLETIKEFAKLRWRSDSGPHVCDLDVAALHCTSNAKDPSQSIKLDLTMAHPYGFLWPISAFSLASIARAEEKRRHEVLPVQVITVEEPSIADPVFPLVIDGRLRYIGKVDVTLAGRKWKADKFELEVPLHPKFLILTAREGFLLDLIVEDPTSNSPLAELKLIRYQQFADF